MATIKKGGLGKGLDALFSNSPIENEEEKQESKQDFVQMLKLIDVEPNRSQARRSFDEESLNELAESIKNYGVIQPIIVTKKQGFYEIVAGERRWRASKIAGLTEIPAIIKENDDRKNKEISLIENVQREDLNAYEKALGIRQLIDDYNLTQQEVADILGKSRSSIANTVRLLNLDYRVLKFIQEGKLFESHCRPLLALSDRNEQYKMALKIIEMGSTAEDINETMRIKKNAPKKREKKYEAIFKDIEDSFQGFFGSKVRLDAGKKKGRIVIEYTSNQDLERMLELIKKSQ